MDQHKAYIAHDMVQRQVQKRPVPADYPNIVSPLVPRVKPAKRGTAGHGEGQQLALVRFGVANAAGKNVEAKSMLAKDPQGDQITVEVGPTMYAPTLSLSDVYQRKQMHQRKQVDHTPVVPACPHPCGACRF